MNRSNSGQCITYIGRFALIILLTFVIVRIMFITHEKSSEIEPESLKNYPPVLRTATVPISKNEDRYSSNTVIKTLKFNASYVKRYGLPFSSDITKFKNDIHFLVVIGQLMTREQSEAGIGLLLLKLIEMMRMLFLHLELSGRTLLPPRWNQSVLALTFQLPS